MGAPLGVSYLALKHMPVVVGNKKGISQCHRAAVLRLTTETAPRAPWGGAGAPRGIGHQPRGGNRAIDSRIAGRGRSFK